MKRQKWNEGWKFWADKDSFALVWNVPENAREINLPHDAMIEEKADPESPNKGNTGFRNGGVYTYVKNLYVPEEAKGKTMMLEFEGVYMNAQVYVNEQLAAKNMFGYTTFFVKLDDFLRYGADNEIRVQVRNNNMTNSRWYSGTGIYRDVYLLESGMSYLVPEGVQIRCESADEDYAVLKINSEIKNREHGSTAMRLKHIIRDESGQIVAEEESAAVLFDQEERTLTQRIVVGDPKLWSAEKPVLYTCETILYVDGKEADSQTEKFGIRTLALDARRGLRVNGESVKLRGACIHHDSGLLGAATFEETQYRQVRKLKEAGFNAIRMSHHPMAPAMLRACDEIGMYVMDETFDMWNRCKSDLDYGLYFQEWWEKDVTAMVRKDYNHPSVLLYSVGNEIPEIGTDHGAKTCHDICEKIRSLDDTRFTLASINGVFAAGDKVDQIVADVSADLVEKGELDGNVNDFMTLMDDHMDEIVVHDAISERLEKACASVDIAGYNYMTARYEMDGEKYPNRVIVGSETYPPEIARNWELVKKLAHVIGDFTWTGWDYIGEAGVGVPAYQWGEGGFGAGFPCQLAYSGDIDITGFRRPASYFREVVFGLRKEPYITVQDPNHYGQNLIKTPWVISDSVSTWNWKGCEGKPVVVEIYAPGDEVELFVNGVSQGRKPSGVQAGYRTLFETVYEPGNVTAVTYESGQEMGRMELQSADADAELWAQTEDTKGKELVYIDIALKDKEGRVLTDSDVKLTAEVTGDASAAGFGSGNPKPVYNFNEGVTETFHGRALLILRKTKEGGHGTVTFRAEDGRSATVTY